jgi:tetratricopeptide (TPR) repeat protein
MSGRPVGKPKSLDVTRTFEHALALHHQGRFAEADGLYSAVLAAQPHHCDALQMLGLVKLRRGDPAAALKFVASAMRLRPNAPQVLLNYGLVLNVLDRHEEALASFDRALKHKRKFAEALNNRRRRACELRPGARAATELRQGTLQPRRNLRSAGTICRSARML